MFAARRTLAASLFVLVAAGAATLPARGDEAKPSDGKTVVALAVPAPASRLTITKS